jgi:1-acyl-sn-glycerol-3-phosphate acyltransferase
VTGAPIVPLMMYGTRPAGGGKDALPEPGAVLDLVYGAPLRVVKRPWPRTKTLVAATSAALHERMRDELRAGLVSTGQTLPGPIPAQSAEEIS